MFNITFENMNGKKLLFGAGSPYTITEFDGLNPPKATINTNTTATLDGGLFNSSKLEMRSINIAFAIEEDAEKNRLAIYEVIQPKNPLRIYFASDYLDIFIDGYVEELSIPYFAKKQIVSVSVLCPRPYFNSAQEIINRLSAVIPRFHFPFASTVAGDLVIGEIDPVTSVVVENAGNVMTGLTFELIAKNTIANPKIIDYQTAQYLEVNTTMQTGDQITITTGQGNKTVKLLRNGVITNIFNLLSKNSTWLQLGVNGGVYVYEVGTGNVIDLEVNIRHYDQYEGV